MSEFFLDDFGKPLVPHEDFGVPELTLFDSSNYVLSRTNALVGNTAGEWLADVLIPAMPITEQVAARLVWKFVSDANGTYRVVASVAIVPRVTKRETVSIAIEGVHSTFTFDLPWVVEDTAIFTLYQENTILYSHPANSHAIKLTNHAVSTNVVLPLTGTIAAMSSYLLTITTSSDIVVHKVWVITPQILKGATSLEEFLNKARIEDTIVELQYTQHDLLGYLERGLNLFNMVGKATTSFNGTNMQGHLFDAWLTCSSYYALAAQLQAEGMLAFDFSGQSVSLSVDRTAQIESALGRVEGEINDKIVPYKALLIKSGVTGGSGSAGSIKSGVTGGSGSAGSKSANFGPNFGVVGLSNSPTTRFPHRMRYVHW